MAGSIASQLAALKSIIKSDTEPQRRPFTRPSILFNPKEAADIDIDSIYDIADKGLDVLTEKDERFRRYRNDLFSHKSKEVDRELMNKEENKRINESISSFLRLLSGYLELPAARMALEYLIRRYKIHVYNMEELILCALPYHDTHEFVRIVQLIETGNSRWKFLDGVKKSGAPPPRKVIVQQCISDLGLLELICNYAIPTKKARPSGPVTGFCTAIVIEVVGSVTTVESDVVKRILPYLVSALQPGGKGNIEQKAGGLMIVGLLAQRAALSPSLVKSLIRSLALEDGKEWFHMSFMALINLVQLQQVCLIPRKIIDILADRAISPSLRALTEKFNIDKFMVVLIDSLVEHSSSNEKCHKKILEIVNTVPLKAGNEGLIITLLRSCMRTFKGGHPVNSESGSQVKQILVSLHKKYPIELRKALHEILQDTKVQLGKEDSNHELLSQMFSENCDSSLGIINSKVWFDLEHPRADVRRSAIRQLNEIRFPSDEAVDTKGIEIIRDSVLPRLEDDDLTVVQAVLKLDRLNEIIASPLEQLQKVLQRCIHILMAGGSNNSSLANDVAVSCLQCAVKGFKDNVDYVEKTATMIFPLLLVLPKTKRVNLEALELAKEINWPIFAHLVSEPPKKLDIEEMTSNLSKNSIKEEETTSINLENIRNLGENFAAHPEKWMPWIVKCCNGMVLSKTLAFFVLLQSLMVPVIDAARFSVLYDAAFQFLRSEWELLESTWNAMNVDEVWNSMNVDELNLRVLERDCRRFLAHLLDTNTDKLNAEILFYIFRRLLVALFKTAPQDDKKGTRLSKLQNLFVFFASSGHIFKNHIHFLVTKCKETDATGFCISPRFLCEMFTAEGTPVKAQAESLSAFALLCSKSDASLAIQLLAEFPSMLVPLSSDSQDVRTAAMRCIEELYTMSACVDLSSYRNGNIAVWFPFLEELLGLIVQQKKLILSNKDVLPSFFKSLLSQSCDSLLVEPAIGKRFDQSTKDKILDFLLESPLNLSAYAKLKILYLLKGLGSKVMQVGDIKSLLSKLLSRRHRCHIMPDNTSLDLSKTDIDPLSKTDIDLLCILLECCTMPTSSVVDNDTGELILKVLEVNRLPSEDPAIVEPCKMVLKNLGHLYDGLKTKTQENIFRALVFLFRNADAVIQNASRDVLLRIDVSCSVIHKMLDEVLDNMDGLTGSVHRKKKKKGNTVQKMNNSQQENPLSFVSSLLDVMLLKKDIKHRASLVGSMFKLLRKVFMDDDWAHEDLEESFPITQTFSEFKVYLQQISLLILEDVVSSVHIDEKDDLVSQFDFGLLVSCARLASDVVSRNHLLSLFSTVAKVLPDQVLDHILDILIVVGDSALMQWDDHSKRVFEDLISAAIPLWLSKTGDAEKLIQVFVDFLPQIAQHQRLSIVLHLLRNLDEKSSFGLMLFQLFRSLVSKDFFCFDGEPSLDLLTSAISNEWEYLFAITLSEQYSCTIWLPSIVLLLQKIGTSSWNNELFMQLIVSMRFVFYKLQDPEIPFKLDSGELDMTQVSIGALMEQVVYLLQLVDSRRKQMAVSSVLRKLLKENMHIVLKNIAKGLAPTSYFKVITKLLRNADKSVGKKALGLLCQTVKEIHFGDKNCERRGLLNSHQNSWLHFDDSAEHSLDEMCTEVLGIVDDMNENSAGTQLKLAAISAVEALAERFPSSDTVFNRCLKSTSKSIHSSNYAVSSSSLRTTAVLINVLGPRALSELPGIMKVLLIRSDAISTSLREGSGNHDDTSVESVKLRDSVTMSVLVTLEAVIDKLGSFLNPYLSSILELLVLHPRYASSSAASFRLKADAVRKLITVKIPVRLLFPPLKKIFKDACKSGESSLSVLFDMLREMIGIMDKSSTVAYYEPIFFDLCLPALGLRSQQPPPVKDINVVEGKVIESIVSLTDKLTETMFKTLFLKSVEWSESSVDGNKSGGNETIGRAISFYGLIDKISERHRSIFVPYFKYLIDGSVRHLSDDAKDTIPKKKKAKLQTTPSDRSSNRMASPEIWHLRYLILSSLHKCFLYDVGEPKFLEGHFQVLLEPIVSQLSKDPPSSLDENLKPSIEEVDDLLVICVGQMAVTASSDLLWKSLNHEVLMQTRSEKVRARILGLRIVKYLVENLREEYLVLLPETIPFMSELLEDVHLPVKTLAQEILKEMESMSGESLRDYL